MIKMNVLSNRKNKQFFNASFYVILFLTIGFVSCESNSESDLLENTEVLENTEILENTDPLENTEVLVVPDNDEPVVTPEEPTEPNILSVTYEGRAKTIFDSSCVECHGEIGARRGVRLDNFEMASANSARALARMQNTSNPMPPNGNLPNTIVADIESWINDGLLEN